MLRDYLGGMPIADIKNAYSDHMRDLTFYISTVGDVIDAARHNAITSAALEAAGVRARPRPGMPAHPSMVQGMSALKEGVAASWKLGWAGHQVFDGAAAMDPARGF